MTDDFDSFNIDGFTELFDNSTVNKFTAAIVALLVVFLGANTLNLLSKNDGVRSIVDGNNNWQVTFDEQIITITDSVIVADGDTETRMFTLDQSLLDEDYRFGKITVTLSYTETSGIPGDPIDSVFANIVQNDLVAQWQGESNNLSGSSNDGGDLVLNLKTYPDYDGQVRNETGYNAIQVLEEWTLDGFGMGELELEISVETSALPFTNDNEEEVSIMIELTVFKANASK